MSKFHYVAAVLLAVFGFVAGRWVGKEKETTLAAPSDPMDSLEEDAVKALLAPPPSSGVAGIGWMKQIFAGDLEALEAELLAMDEDDRTAVCLAVIGRMDATMMRSLVEMHWSNQTLSDLGSWFEATGEIVPFAFADRWAELDPAGMASYAKELLAAKPDVEGEREGWDDMGAEQLIAFGAVMSLAERDPEGALEIANLMSGEFAEYAVEMAIGVVAKTDLDRAIEMMRETVLFEDAIKPNLDLGTDVQAAEGEVEREMALVAILDHRADLDPAGAFAAARDAGSRNGMQMAVRCWATSDPQAAIESLALLGSDERAAVGGEFVESWARSEPLAAIEWTEENLDREVLDDLLDEHIDELPSEVAMRYLASSEDGIAGGDDAFDRYAQEDPMAAIEWLSEQPAELIEKLKVEPRNTGESLAMLGADAVREGLAIIPPGEFRTGTIRSALEFIGYNDPSAAQAMVAGLSGAERTAALEGLAMGWVESEPRAAVDFVHAQGDGATTESALTRWSMMDPAAAHGWMMETEGSDPAALAERVKSSAVATYWSHVDPLAASEAMLALPQADAGQQMANVIEIWGRNEPIAASAFINDRLEPSYIRDKAVIALIEQIRTRDPDGAAEWLESIDDPNLRTTVTGAE